MPDHDRLLAAIDEGRERSYGTDHHSFIGQVRAETLEYYYGLNRDPAPEGRSQIVDRSVYETIATMHPALVRIFASSSEEVCKATPVGPEDEQGAGQQTAVLNHVVTQLNNWEQIVADWTFDAMMFPNAYCIAYWDESQNSIRERYDGQSDDQVAALMSDTGVKVVQHSSTVDEQATQEQAQAFQQAMQQWQMATQQAQMQGMSPPEQPPQPGPVMLHDLVIERVENTGKVCIKVLPAEHCMVSIDTPNWLLDECPYFEYRCEKTIADLRAMGLDVPDDINDDEDPTTEEDQVRDFYDEQSFGDEGSSRGVMRRVWSRMIWVRCDADDDGASRLHYVIAVGRTILYAEPTSRIPVSSMVSQAMPHRHPGLPVAETVKDIQDIRTAVTRGGLDNLYLANAGRHAISSQVNLEDFLDARPGGVVRMQGDALPAEGHIMPLTHPVVFEQVIGSLEYFDQVRQNRTGATRYFSGTDAGAINKTAAGTGMLQNAAAMRVEHIARMMAPAVENLFSIVQEVIAKHENKALTIKVAGNWQTVDPQAWRTKRDMRISVGVGAGNKESMMAQLGNIFGAQMQLLPMNLAGPQQIHATVTEMAKMAGFANPAKFWQDPTNMPPAQPPPSPEMIKAQTEQQKMQFQAQQDQMRFQAEQQFETQKMQMQAQVDAQREEMQARQKQLELEQQAQLAQLQAQYQAQQDQRRIEFEQWKASLDASVKLEIANASNQTAMDTAQPKADPQIGQVVQMLQQLMEEANQPAEIVRDPNTGKAMGIKRGSKTRSIVRGPDGRAVGVQ
jgi:hypothetical protein